MIDVLCSDESLNCGILMGFIHTWRTVQVYAYLYVQSCPHWSEDTEGWRKRRGECYEQADTYRKPGRSRKRAGRDIYIGVSEGHKSWKRAFLASRRWNTAQMYARKFWFTLARSTLKFWHFQDIREHRILKVPVVVIFWIILLDVVRVPSKWIYHHIMSQRNKWGKEGRR